MQKIINFTKQYWQFAITLFIGLIALVSAIILNDFDNDISRITVITWAIFMSILLFSSMVKTLYDGKYGVDILAITAIAACILVGQFWAALIIVLMLTGGETLEDYAAGRAKRELSALLKRTPTITHLLKGDLVTDIEISEVKVDDILLIKANEVIPVDGILISESVAEFDESMLTGESLPVAKKAGDSIMSGSLNGNSSVKIRASSTAENSQYAKIINLVKAAESEPAPFVRLADQYAIPFTIISYLIAGSAWYFSGDPARFAEVLVVASPCPLILAAPIALMSGMSVASKHGIIVKNGFILEKFRQVDAIAFDKTGTLTQGHVEICSVNLSKKFAQKYDEEKLLSLAASAESGSSHVLASSLLAFAKSKKIKLSSAENVREIAGSGIYATVNKSKVLIGQFNFLKQNKIKNLPENTHQTSMFIALDGEYAGQIAFEDRLRPEAKKTVQHLKKLGLREIVMLTGDKKSVASEIASKIDIDFRAELLPEDKVLEIKKLRKEYNSVAMVGDGVNDAPVLATADVGIAMGARGNTAASESADAVIMLDDISRVELLRRISQHTIKIALQSVWVGIALCIILMLIASFGFIPAIVGAGLQELIDVAVIINALRAHHLKTNAS